MTKRIEAARAEDIPALLTLIQSAYRGNSARQGWTHEADLLGGGRIDAAMLADMLADPVQQLLIAHDRSGPIGCVSLSHRGDLFYLGLLTVAPEAQGTGLGGILLDHAERLAGGSTIEMTVIAARAELIAWYIRRGYAPTGERRPFPYGDDRFGTPLRDDLEFVVLAKTMSIEQSIMSQHRTGRR